MTATVTELSACEALVLEPGRATLTTTLDADRGCPRLVQRVLRAEPGESVAGRAGGAGELWYVSGGAARVTLGGQVIPLEPDVGLLVQPGSYELVVADSGDRLEMAIVVLPEGVAGVPDGLVRSSLGDREAEVTGDRHFRVLVGPEQGCRAATQFVGDIPPGRAPVHEHTYDEVVLVLSGAGVVHLEGGDRPIHPGTCIYLPPGSPHCLENTGRETMRVIGVFHPGGSPSSKKEHEAA